MQVESQKYVNQNRTTFEMSTDFVQKNAIFITSNIKKIFKNRLKKSLFLTSVVGKIFCHLFVFTETCNIFSVVEKPFNRLSAKVF